MALYYILSFLMIFLIEMIYSEEETCNAENEACDKNDEEIVVTDHLEHIWKLPKNYDCENERDNKDCEYWKTKTNACENNAGFMILSCPKSCGFCHLVDPSVRCQRHPNAKAAVGPGDIDKMFNRLLTNFPEYSPEVLSSPNESKNPGPWIVVLNNVFTDEECDTLIKIGGKNFRRSVDAGKMKGDGAKFEEIVSDARTSSTDWCTRDCWNHPIIQNIAKKAEHITLIPKENSEYFQVLRYEVGQYYVQHHDYIYGHLDLPIGPRVYTFFLYLNTPQSGGGTKFNKLNITIPAKKGRVAIWPSVLNDNPFKKEHRTNHEALPVQEGVKYGANMWLHMYNFHDPYKVTCTG